MCAKKHWITRDQERKKKRKKRRQKGKGKPHHWGNEDDKDDTKTVRNEQQRLVKWKFPITTAVAFSFNVLLYSILIPLTYIVKRKREIRTSQTSTDSEFENVSQIRFPPKTYLFMRAAYQCRSTLFAIVGESTNENTKKKKKNGSDQL